MPSHPDSFELYDLRVEVVATGRPMVCDHHAGDFFELRGENLTLPPGQSFSIYALAALLPLLPAKQRVTHPNDWMTRRRSGVSRPALRCALPYHAHGFAHVSAQRSNRSAIA